MYHKSQVFISSPCFQYYQHMVEPFGCKRVGHWTMIEENGQQRVTKGDTNNSFNSLKDNVIKIIILV